MLPVTTVPDTYSGIYVDQQINSFLNNARTFQAAGFTEKEMADALIKDIPVRVELDRSSGSGGPHQYIYYFRYVPYLALALLGFVIGNVLLVFVKRSEAQNAGISGFFQTPGFGGNPLYDRDRHSPVCTDYSGSIDLVWKRVVCKRELGIFCYEYSRPVFVALSIAYFQEVL